MTRPLFVHITLIYSLISTANRSFLSLLNFLIIPYLCIQLYFFFNQIYVFFLFFFFFSSRRRHTRFDCDLSSDVCSSDLPLSDPSRRRHLSARRGWREARRRGSRFLGVPRARVPGSHPPYL